MRGRASLRRTGRGEAAFKRKGRGDGAEIAEKGSLRVLCENLRDLCGSIGRLRRAERRRPGLQILLALILAVVALPAFAAPAFPPLTGRVVDNAHLLSPAAQQKLTGELADLEARTGRQLVVATLPDLQGYEIEEYGYQLGRAWGIGRAGKNDGALLIVAPKERKVRIEVGYGLEPVLTDALSSTIVNSAVLPEFRAGRMEAGVVAGTEAIIRQLSLPDDDAKAQVAQAAAARPQAAPSGGGIPTIVVALIIFFILARVLRGLGGRRGGGGLWWLLPLLLSSGGRRGGWDGGGGGGFSGGGGGFSGGGGSFGGGGSSGSW